MNAARTIQEFQLALTRTDLTRATATLAKVFPEQSPCTRPRRLPPNGSIGVPAAKLPAPPYPSSQRLATQREIVRTARAALANRNLIAVEVVGDPVIGASNSAAYLRKLYRVPPETFKALLVGKDSGVKLVSSEPLTAQQLNATIDAVPMRRAEMKGR